ncbi:hypothetical protein EHS13_30415 [Paenibacillus psychroresistens]|uniref:SRPBCC family protein n=1 Tax=Paenibacillus psychroresistens TaxID=1778678 RepID=A0A6B8RUC1_9BACL|nr:hypothetical protein [Paenibacillus psychroresistens]QGQ98886.1 hypothetical protein EHS13_30415 [Paenibacillus psychroresistens]
MQNPKLYLWYGFLASNLFAYLMIVLTRELVLKQEGTAGIITTADFIFLPILMGIICAYFWKDLGLRTSGRLIYTTYNFIFVLFVSAKFMGEGIICLIIVSPLLIAFMMLGVWIGKVMFEKGKRTLNIGIVSILFLVILVDPLTQHNNQHMVTDTMLIKASPQQIWEHVVAFKPIEAKSKYWLFSIGMPQPMESTVDAYALGANRKCIFSNGMVFDEKITVFEPNVNLTFTIVKQPEDPEIMGHIQIQEGQFLLHDNGDGTTTLTGNSRYELYVYPAWYYNIWAKSITRNVHLRAMEHIKKLSEAAAS